MMKKKHIFFFFGLSVFISLFLLRHTIFSTALEFALQKNCGGEVVYANRQWKGNKLVYEGLHLGSSLYIEKAELDLSFHRDPFYFEGHLLLTGPKLILDSQPSDIFLPGFIPSNLFALKCDIERGEVAFEDDVPNLSFAFVSGDAKDEIGTLLIYDALEEAQEPLFYCELAKTDGKLALEWDVARAPLKRLLELCGCFNPVLKQGWEDLQGIAAAHGKCETDQNFVLMAAVGKISLESAVMTNRDLGVHVQLESCQTELSYPLGNPGCPIWEQISGFASIQGGEFLLFEPLVQKQWGVVDCDATVTLDLHKEPACSLEGKIFYRDQAYPLTLQAKGVMHDDASFWIESKVELNGEENISTRLGISLCSPSLDAYVVQADIDHMDQTVFAMALDGLSFHFPEVQDLSLFQGKLQGCITGWVEKGELARVQWNNVHLHDIGVSGFEAAEQVFFKEAHSSGEMEKASIASLTLELKGGAAHCGKWKISDAEAVIGISHDVFQDASLEGIVMGIPGKVELTGSFREYEAALHFAAPLPDWLRLNTKEEYPLVSLEATCKKGERGYAVTGSFICNDEEIRFGAEFEEAAKIREGWFESPRLTLNGYSPLLKYFDSNIQLEGAVSFSGEILQEKISGKCATRHIRLTSPRAVFETASETEARFLYLFQENKLNANAFLEGVTVQERLYGLVVDQLEGELFFEDGKIHVDKCLAQCEGIQISGQADLAVLGDGELQISTESLEGSVENLSKLCAHFPDNALKDLPLRGNFYSGKNGFRLFVRESMASPDWRLKAKFQDVAFPISNTASLEQLAFDFDFDSSAKVGVITNAVAELYLISEGCYRFSSPYIQYKDHFCEFDVQLEKEGKEILKLIGSGKEIVQGKFQLSMTHEKNHFFSSSWDKCVLNLEGKEVSSFELVTHLQGKDLYSQAIFLSDAGLLSLDAGYLEPLKKIDGEIIAKLALPSPGNLFFEAEGSRMSFDGDKIQKFALKGKRVGEQWIFEKITADDMFFKGSISQGICPYWELRWKDVVVRGDASVNGDLFLRVGAIEGVLPPSYRIKGLKTARLSFAPQLTLSEIDLAAFEDEIKVGRISADALVYNSENKKWESEKVRFNGALFGSKDPLTGFLSVKWSPRFFSFQGMVEQGSVSWSNASFKPKQIMGYYEYPSLNLKCQATLERAPIHVQAKLNLSKGYQGSVTLQDEAKEQNIVISLRENLFCDGIVGALYGLDVHLKRNQPSDPFSGKIAIRDGNAASGLLPENFSFLKDIKNIEFVGAWKDFTFQGELRGSDVTFKDYLFQEVHAGIQFTPEQVYLKNVALADPAGTCSIKQMELKREKTWAAYIPLVKVQNFRPSTMRKIGSEAKEAKPFVIRNLVLTDVHAEIGDKLSLSGRGSLNFTNVFKKEASLFEAPIAMLKNLGLDLELFSPASGEVECVLKGNRIFLSNLKNTFSEGKHSQFYFASDLEPSFIDLDGNIHINVRMKQDVVLKIVEPFALTIRGTWEKPTYGLR